MRGLHGLSALLGLAAACAVGPDHVEPEPALPPAYVEAGGESGPAGTDPWWLQLEDETLQQLIRDAVAGNFDLRIAAARVEEVRAQYRIAKADRFPRVDAAASAERGRDSEHTEFPGATSTHNRFTLGLESSWELDFWGRVRRSVEAAEADHAAVEALLADARRLVIARVAGENV